MAVYLGSITLSIELSRDFSKFTLSLYAGGFDPGVWYVKIRAAVKMGGGSLKKPDVTKRVV